ncbi:MAG: hypothetical protein Q4G68_01445 [Planctomycetia bacterium]|nr:hypothetical protein [Planctomycetia bacterium]
MRCFKNHAVLFLLATIILLAHYVFIDSCCMSDENGESIESCLYMMSVFDAPLSLLMVLVSCIFFIDGDTCLNLLPVFGFINYYILFAIIKKHEIYKRKIFVLFLAIGIATGFVIALLEYKSNKVIEVALFLLVFFSFLGFWSGLLGSSICRDYHK